MNKRIVALIAVSIATLIYGVTFTIAKEVMPLYIKPYAFIFLRVSGATIDFLDGRFVYKIAKNSKRRL
jgi:drug/metabolite transporter (DMT)-like permease